MSSAPTLRPAKTSPVYDKFARMGAVFGQRYGWERANWFAPPGVAPADKWSFRRSNYFEHVGNESLRLRQYVGVIDLTPFHQARGQQDWARRPSGSTASWPIKYPLKSGGLRLLSCG